MLYNKNNLLVSNIASKDETRPVLTGVRFEEKATIATDGYKLMIVSTPPDDSIDDVSEIDGAITPVTTSTPVNIPSENVKQLSKSLPKKPILPWFSNTFFTSKDDEMVEMVTTDGINHQKHTTKAIVGDYPQYNAILPKDKPQAVVSLNVKILKQVIDTINQMDISDNANTIKISLQGELQPVSITTTTDQKQQVQAVIMPVRTKKETD